MLMPFFHVCQIYAAVFASCHFAGHTVSRCRTLFDGCRHVMPLRDGAFDFAIRFFFRAADATRHMLHARRYAVTVDATKLPLRYYFSLMPLADDAATLRRCFRLRAIVERCLR